MSKLKRTTAKQFAQFKREFLRWQEKLWCQDWEVYFSLATIGCEYARIEFDLTTRVATAFLAKKIPAESAPLRPKENAKHEAIHLLTAELAWLASQKKADQDRIYSANEALTHKLERLL